MGSTCPSVQGVTVHHSCCLRDVPHLSLLLGRLHLAADYLGLDQLFTCHSILRGYTNVIFMAFHRAQVWGRQTCLNSDNFSIVANPRLPLARWGQVLVCALACLPSSDRQEALWAGYILYSSSDCFGHSGSLGFCLALKPFCIRPRLTSWSLQISAGLGGGGSD